VCRGSVLWGTKREKLKPTTTTMTENGPFAIFITTEGMARAPFQDLVT
jgi:hypothetical protein